MITKTQLALTFLTKFRLLNIQIFIKYVKYRFNVDTFLMGLLLRQIESNYGEL